MKKIIPPPNPLPGGEGVNLDGFMIGRASFGNPWCFLPGNYVPSFGEILDTMQKHAKLLIELK
ncbi:TPA: hypothetical protein DCZ31_01970 [Patescibacteria group bacterium]|nr:hypothetical protein [Candidatus Gracilibacteria bacterium]